MPVRCASVQTQSTKKAPKDSINNKILISAGKLNVPQSPWKMNFLVKLIRGAWLPDALAQLKFSPKHRAVDVAQIVQRASTIAKTFHEAIPEELIVDEVMVTKGLAVKRQRIMGRGRTGLGYRRNSHVSLKVAIIDFEKQIADAKTQSQKQKWLKRFELVKHLKSLSPAPLTSTPVV